MTDGKSKDSFVRNNQWVHCNTNHITFVTIGMNEVNVYIRLDMITGVHTYVSNVVEMEKLLELLGSDSIKKDYKRIRDEFAKKHPKQS